MSNEAKWYVVHTYSGYENKVKDSIEKTVANRNMEEVILDIKVPTEEVVEVKDDKKKVVTRKKYGPYVMVKMYMTDETWYIIRNTRGVTGFVGPGGKPVPLTEEEVLSMGIENKVVEVGYNVGDNVSIKYGPLEGFMGTVEEIMLDKYKVKVVVSMFGRETPVELDFNQVEVV